MGVGRLAAPTPCPHARRNPRRATARPEAGECGVRRLKALADSLTSHASVSCGTGTSRQTGYSEERRARSPSAGRSCVRSGRSRRNGPPRSTSLSSRRWRPRPRPTP